MPRGQALDGKRLNAFAMDPDDLVIIGLDTKDKEDHPQYDERAFLPVEEAMVNSIRVYGIIEPIVVAKDGDTVIVIDGRGRVKAAREAKKRQKKAGEIACRVPCMVKRGTAGVLMGVSRAANAHRRNDGILTNAKNAQRMLDQGQDEATVAITFGVEVATLRNWLALLDLDPMLHKAVEGGQLGATAAAKLAKLSRIDQRKELIKLRAEGRVTTVAAAAAVRKKTNGKNGKATVAGVAPGKRLLKKLLDARQRGDATFSSGVYEGIAFAIGELEATEIDGMSAAIVAVTAEAIEKTSDERTEA